MGKVKEHAVDQIQATLDVLAIEDKAGHIALLVLSDYDRYPLDNQRLLRDRIAQDFAVCRCGEKPVCQLGNRWYCSTCYVKEWRNA